MKLITLRDNQIAKVDDEDFALLSQYKWHEDAGYARMNAWKMHELVLGVAPQGKVWDHIDRDKLNNQRHNLRLVTQAQNRMNSCSSSSTGFKGVTWHKRKGKYEVKIMKDGVSYYLGSYHTKQEAAIVYNKKAKELFGEYAFLNQV